MKKLTLLFGIVLVCATCLALFGYADDVSAIGTPSDNLTAPDSSLESQVEIKPRVESALLGPTLQADITRPNIIPGFIGQSEQNNFTVTGQERWYLQLDINRPGWIYIYEYFKVANEFTGKWIAYKWQLPQGGVWELGPFTSSVDEAEGQHIYRFWLYSDGAWAGQDSNILVEWTYLKSPPAEQPAQPGNQTQPVAPPAKASFFDSVIDFLNKQVVLIVIILLIIALILVGFYLYRRYWSKGKAQDSTPTVIETEPEKITPPVSMVVSAKITLPNGIELLLDGNTRVIGRGDMTRVLDTDTLGLISRQHFKINREDEQFYIQDLDSANGTRLNDTDIAGKGAVVINSGDIIEPAGVIQLKFTSINPSKTNL